MTEEQVENVRGEDANSGGDHGSLKANGVAQGVGALDLVADNNGLAKEQEEKICKDAVSNGAPEEASQTATVDVVSREGELNCLGSPNAAGSVRNGAVENGDDGANAAAEELVADHDEYVVVGASDVQNSAVAEGEVGSDVNVDVNGVEECDVSGDENGVVVEGDADANRSDREFEGVVVVDRAEDGEVNATACESTGNNLQGRSRSITTNDVDKSEESEHVVSADEKDIVTNENDGAEDVVEKSEVVVDVGAVSATTGVKECEPEDAQKRLEKAQVEHVSDDGVGVPNGLAELEPERCDCTKENKIAVEGELDSKLERSEEDSGSELVAEREDLTALNSTDVVEDVDVVSDIAVERDGEPSVDVCDMKSNAVIRDVEHSVEVCEMKDSPENIDAEPPNDAVQNESIPFVVSEMRNNTEESEAEPLDSAVQRESEPSVDLCEMKSHTVECEAEPSNGAVESEAEPSCGVVESGAEPSNGTVESEVEPSSGTMMRESEPSVDACVMKNNVVESEAKTLDVAVGSEAEPSNGAVESEAKPSDVAVEDEAELSNGAVECEAEPSNGAVESEVVPSNGAVKSEAVPSNVAVDSEAVPSNFAVESEAKPSDFALKSEVETSNGTVESETEPSEIAVESEAEPSNVELESEPETSNVAVENKAETSNVALENEAKPSEVAVENEAGPSNGAVESESVPPSNGLAETETEPSNGALESEAEPLNGALESEAEPSNGAVKSEAQPFNGAVEIKSEHSVDVHEIKNNAVESEAENSKGAVECEAETSVEGGLSVEGEGSHQGDEDSRPASDALDGQIVGAEVLKKPFYYLIRVPRYDDDGNIKEQIKNALHQVDEKTKIRDAIRAESQIIKASCKECDQEVKAAIAAGRAARELLKSKRQEMDSVQSTMNRLNNAISVGDIDGKIRNMEHMIQHETLPLNEEKQLIRQIKQLKQNREELSSNMRNQDQLQQSVDHKDNIEEQFKALLISNMLLKKEMDVLRNNVMKSDATTKAAKKKYSDECDKLNELLARFKAADDIRQEAYGKLHALKKQLHEKSKNFWEYKSATSKAHELAVGGKHEELQCFCVDQVERIMELWNKNDEFRRDYVRCNTRSTLRRLQTLDGRSLGPDEEPPVIPNAITERAVKNNSMVSHSTQEQEKKPTSTESVSIKDEPVSKVVVQRTETNQTTKARKPTKPAPLEKSATRWGDEPDEDEKEQEKEPVRTKEEEEMIQKAEKASKGEEEAKLKEKRRQEEIEKAKEALQRKNRIAEKAQQRALLKAQKEAELKEKEREKRARKKERRKAASAVTAENTEEESAPISETVTRSIEECDQSEKPAEVTKKAQKASQFTRQTKTKSVPLALRNRGKRRIQPWMWVVIAVMVVVALFYVGNSSSLRSSLAGFGF
ncbi:hypothetical protein Fmac_001902 [Flemingia macrophylla]|uniref:Uncharacterized protein n=1 Tax=Flemingia macrophylla TaxID=520843 RepID=A0ABD1NIF1_9FABA